MPRGLHDPAVVVITGAMAAGKSTIAEELAGRLPRAAHVRGDAFRKMIVSGRAEMSPPLTEAAKAQLRLRQHLAAGVADGYASAGITAVVQDLYLGSDLAAFLGLLRHRPVYVVVLAPRSAVLEEREQARGKSGYGAWSAREFDRHLREATPRVGLWLDSSELTVEGTVDAILGDLDLALVDPATITASPASR